MMDYASSEYSQEYSRACMEIAEAILSSQLQNKEDIARIKKKVSKKYSLPSIPGDADVLSCLQEVSDSDNQEEINKLRKILRLKPVRTISGVAVISVMTSPASCPHGKCLPCPGGVEKNTPQSYIGLEPAAQRGRQHEYNPYNQVRGRLAELVSIGHDVDKAEIIVMGGTFPARERSYKQDFMLGIFNALNTFGNSEEPSQNGEKDSGIEQAKEKNERARVRCTGITFETRPDYAKRPQIEEMLEFGGTKVELGVQTVYDSILEKINRGHGVEDTIEATRLLKDSAFKVGYHVMPGLPYSDMQKDEEMFRELFTNPDFKPDYLKIYPTLVVEGTELHQMWEKGEYRPYNTDEVIDLIASAKRHFPPWVRVQRIQRDIPIKNALGLDKGNIRQMVHQKLKEYGYNCNCIRCREVGHRGIEEAELELVVRKYDASKGEDYFISYETPHDASLAGFIRLRFPYEPFIEPLKDAALVRELHVYGKSLPLGLRDEGAFQHKSIGKRLLANAEEIAKQKYDRIAVISGVGVREYYRKLGYEKSQEYMVKNQL
ncbi:MAG: tRNA uridine(34) 5-carboxymethylaminomethyl modification radical SAM/GNAT enzyme Elp3 [Archaeoglobaceae archaeon]